jgi:hypothetical protein
VKKLIILLTLVLVACSSQAEGETYERFVTHGTNDNYLFIIEDTETGCRYLQFEGDREGGITPLLKGDGLPSC